MNKQLLLVAEAFSNEKRIDREVVFDAIQSGLESATKKLAKENIGVRVALDHDVGDYKTYRYWDVVADEDLDPELADQQFTVEQAKERDPDAKVGDRIEELMESIEFGRIAAQAAKQAMMQIVRDAERKLVAEEYEPRIGELLTGIVKKTIKDGVLLDLGGKAEALLPRSEMLPHEIFRPSDRARAYLYKVEAQTRGPQLFVSRACPEMLVELFRIEVPEIGEEVIEVKGAARDPGYRAKIAVKTNDGRIDPIGACVGMRGARVQAVSSELAGERVDIILWDDNPAQLVINAMSPAEISSIEVDEDKHSMDLVVSPEQLSQAIGRSGQNVRLASDLTGWTLNVMTEEEFADKDKQRSTSLTESFVEELSIEEEAAQKLVDAGFTSIEEIAYVSKEELLALKVFEENFIDELRDRANDILLSKALGGDVQKPDDDLLKLEGMTEELAQHLASKGIISSEDLAEQSIDDLLQLADISEQEAGALIMKAREPWFAVKDETD